MSDTTTDGQPATAGAARWARLMAMPLPNPSYEIRFGDVWLAGPDARHVCDGTGLLCMAFSGAGDELIASGDEATVTKKTAAWTASGLDGYADATTLRIPVHEKTVRLMNLAKHYRWDLATTMGCLGSLTGDGIELPPQIPA